MMVIPIFVKDNKVQFSASDDEKHLFMRGKKIEKQVKMTVFGTSYH